MLEDLPFVLYQDRDQLPNQSGVYIVADAAIILYVGQSKDMKKRWRQHHRGLDMRNHFRIYWKDVPLGNLYLTESFLIEELKPSLNRSRVASFDFAPSSQQQVRELIVHLNRDGRQIVARAIDELWQREIGRRR